MTPLPKTVWAYTYRIVPPQEADRLRRLKTLLDSEHRDARKRDGTFEGRMIADERISHILVLSDSPDLERAVNRRLEAELRAIDVGFSVTVPMAVPDTTPPTGDSRDIPQTE